MRDKAQMRFDRELELLGVTTSGTTAWEADILEGETGDVGISFEQPTDRQLREVARRLSSPEDAAQKELVRQLELPIDAKDSAKTAERYDDLRNLFGTMGPSVAKRMHKRITDSLDPLGEFMRLELADWHRKELIELAAARAQAKTSSVPPPKPTTQTPVAPTPGPPITGRPPRQVPPIQVTPQKTTTTTKKPPKPIPTPKPPIIFDPKTIQVKFDPNTESWLANSLNGVAKIAGLGLSAMVAVIPGGVLEKAVKAAWAIYMLKRLPANALLGLAGEKAAEVVAMWFLEEKLGIPVSKILNLNDIEDSFIGFDLLIPDGIGSVKAFGVGSKKTGAKLTKQLMSAYRKESNFLFNDFDDRGLKDSRYATYQEKIAKALLKHNEAFKRHGVWPSGLTANSSVKDVIKWYRDNGFMMVLDDHVQLVRMMKGRDYFIQYQQGKLAGFKPGLKDEEVAAQISDLVIRRFRSIGLKSSDLKAMADVAGRLAQAQGIVTGQPKAKWLSTWGQPPSWTASAKKKP